MKEKVVKIYDFFSFSESESAHQRIIAFDILREKTVKSKSAVVSKIARTPYSVVVKCEV